MTDAIAQLIRAVLYVYEIAAWLALWPLVALCSAGMERGGDE